MKITFLGANREVTGSSYLLETEGINILIDCGLFQGGYFSEFKNYENFQFDPSAIDYVVLTHAHLDHCGRLPKLVKEGFNGKIFATNATKDLAKIVMIDSAEIIEDEARENGFSPIFTANDAINAMSFFRRLEYRQSISLGNGISLELKDAGHVLGSAIVEIRAGNKKIVFSGDLGNPPVPILRPTENIEKTDYLIIESTYGDRLHEDYHLRESSLKEAISETAKKKGVLLIPAFALERTQELLYELNNLSENREIPQISTFLDSPMAIKATQIFKKYPEYYNQEAKNLLAHNNDFFHFPNLIFTSTVSESKAIYNHPNPKIIIAGSGMMHGGRILFHAEHYLPDPNTLLLMVGFQVKGSLGRRILNGARRVRIFDRNIKINAKIKAIGAYSAHADQQQLLDWIDQIKKKPAKIFITHGEFASSIALRKKIQSNFKIDSFIPKYKQSVELC